MARPAKPLEQEITKNKKMSLLENIAKNNSELREERIAAIRKLDGQNQMLFADIASNVPYGTVYSEFMESYYLISSATDVGIAAVERLNDQKLLAEVAKKTKDPSVCCAAIEKLSREYQGLFADIATRDNGIVSETALKKLTDKRLLADVAENANSGDVRSAAKVKLRSTSWF